MNINYPPVQPDETEEGVSYGNEFLVCEESLRMFT